MAATAQGILDLIEDIAGTEPARRVGEACAGRRVNVAAAALRAEAHPFRFILGAGAMAALISALGEAPCDRRVLRFPEQHGSTYLRERRERAALIRHLTVSGLTVRDTARKAQVHSRTVTWHRARMRAEGQFPSGSAHG